MSDGFRPGHVIWLCLMEWVDVSVWGGPSVESCIFPWSQGNWYLYLLWVLSVCATHNCGCQPEYKVRSEKGRPEKEGKTGFLLISLCCRINQPWCLPFYWTSFCVRWWYILCWLRQAWVSMRSRRGEKPQYNSRSRELLVIKKAFTALGLGDGRISSYVFTVNLCYWSLGVFIIQDNTLSFCWEGWAPWGRGILLITPGMGAKHDDEGTTCLPSMVCGQIQTEHVPRPLVSVEG